MEPTVLKIYPDCYVAWLEEDINTYRAWNPFKEIAALIDAGDSIPQTLYSITKAVMPHDLRSVVMFYGSYTSRDGLQENPVATKLAGGDPVYGPVVIALEGDFRPLDSTESGYRPVYSFTSEEELQSVFDEIYDIMGGDLYTDDDFEEDDGKYDAYV